MKVISQVKFLSTMILLCFSSFTMADDWSPYSFDTSNMMAVPLYSEEFGVKMFDDESEALSIGIEDSSEGLWKFSLDLNQSQDALFSEEQYHLNTAYSPDGDNSTFYINYGNRRVPVSIKVDEFLDYNQEAYSDSEWSIGFDQKLNDSWAVSISYTKSEIEQAVSGNTLQGFADSSAINQKYWFDLNRDGLPEAVNLFSELGVSSDFNKALEGIEIRLTRKVSEKISIGGVLSQVESSFDWKPLQLSQLNSELSELSEKSLSLFSKFNFASEWSLGAELNHKSYQPKNAPIVSLMSNTSEQLDFDSTTLDIGVQYQGRWDDMGLVIRIDLVNLLGAHSDNSNAQNYNDTGLAPYTFETPKYIKLSGSINF